MRCCVFALGMVAGLNCVAMAAERPSQHVLADMGLSGLVVVSDSEALSVRGFGYSPTRAAGYGWATVAVKGASAGSKNSYSAEGKHASFGHNESEAGVEIETKGGKGGHGGGYGKKGGKGTSFAITAFSGGSSFAGRK
jgi:hypothetical protein